MSEKIQKKTNKRKAKRLRQDKEHADLDAGKTLNRIRNRSNQAQRKRRKKKVELEEDDFAEDLFKDLEEEGDEFKDDAEKQKAKLKRNSETIRQRLGSSAKDIDDLLERMNKKVEELNQVIPPATKVAHVTMYMQTLLNPPMEKMRGVYLDEVAAASDKPEEDPKDHAPGEVMCFDNLTVGQKKMLVAFFYAYNDQLIMVMKPLSAQLKLIMANYRKEKATVEALKKKVDGLTERNASFVTEALETLGSVSVLSTAGSKESSEASYNPGGYTAAGVF